MDVLKCKEQISKDRFKRDKNGKKIFKSRYLKNRKAKSKAKAREITDKKKSSNITLDSTPRVRKKSRKNEHLGSEFPKLDLNLSKSQDSDTRSHSDSYCDLEHYDT